MALPIKPTPVLNEKKSLEFLKKVERDLKKPTGLKDTSKAIKAKKIAMTHAVLGPKQNRG